MITETHPQERCFSYEQIGGTQTADEVEDENNPHIGLLLHCDDGKLYFEHKLWDGYDFGPSKFFLVTDIIKDWCRQTLKEPDSK